MCVNCRAGLVFVVAVRLGKAPADAGSRSVWGELVGAYLILATTCVVDGRREWEGVEDHHVDRGYCVITAVVASFFFVSVFYRRVAPTTMILRCRSVFLSIYYFEVYWYIMIS